jgi:hypothetical protein
MLKPLLLSCTLAFSLSASTIKDFTLHKKGLGENNNTLLVIGGIQGDEPGGFNAASLLVTHYKITKGNLWVVPNLNFMSILKRSRGPYGDMNRKFADLSLNDPEYGIVKKIQKIIRHNEVNLILNLHDGSGFYNKQYIDPLHNPHKWGQSCIIDQATIGHAKYGALKNMADKAQTHINQHLITKLHHFGVKNTKTSEGDAEMAKSLTYYAMQQQKPAFGIEGSKSLPTHERVYYHLLALESFMHQMGIEYKRDFSLTPKGVWRAINHDIDVTLYNTIHLPLKNARTQLRYFPMPKDKEPDLASSTPIVGLLKNRDLYRVAYGNRRVTNLIPQYFTFDYSLESINIKADGEIKEVKIGSVLEVNRDFKVEILPKEYRVNLIGYAKKGLKNEAGVFVKKDEFLKQFSIDKSGTTFRVELYKKEKFSGMVLVRFVPPQIPSARLASLK